jgi:hypothetical protein
MLVRLCLRQGTNPANSGKFDMAGWSGKGWRSDWAPGRSREQLKHVTMSHGGVVPASGGLTSSWVRKYEEAVNGQSFALFGRRGALITMCTRQCAILACAIGEPECSSI